MGRLDGKRTLITGGTSGIGLATARRFLAEGARVILTSNSDGGLATAARELPGAVAIKADAGDPAAQEALADDVKARFGGLDAVFLNAGIAEMRPLADWDVAGFDRSLGIDLKGPYFLVRALLPILANPASIILSGSVNAHLGMPAASVYSLAKAGSVSLARTLSAELVGRGIRANAISPGPIDTPLNDSLGLDAEAAAARRKAVTALVPLGRMGRPEEVANVAVFLASDEAPFIVGSEIVIDGGMTAIR